MCLGYNDIDMALRDLSDSSLSNLCVVISSIIGLDEDVDMFRFVKREMLIRFCSKYLDNVINIITKYAS